MIDDLPCSGGLALARKREFDEDAVLDSVVRRFWSHGFTATTIRDLEAVTGLGAASLYNAYGSKRALFRIALDRYSEQKTRACLRAIEEEVSSPAERIRVFIERVTRATVDDPERLGCLVINTAVELGPHDRDVGATVAGHLQEVEDFFRRNLKSAVQSGEAAADMSPDDAAKAFSALIFGLRVLARTNPDRALMEGAARPLLALLREDPRRTHL